MKCCSPSCPPTDRVTEGTKLLIETVYGAIKANKVVAVAMKDLQRHPFAVTSRQFEDSKAVRARRRLRSN